MKTLMLMLLISITIISCEKNNLVPDNEIPTWLKTKIQQDEQVIKTNPKYMASWGSWQRYEWKNEYYFEYHNPLSSYLGNAISFSGDTMSFSGYDANAKYTKERCCMRYVWKAPNYEEW